jgi:hypothetical protein
LQKAEKFFSRINTLIINRADSLFGLAAAFIFSLRQAQQRQFVVRDGFLKYH